MESMALYELEVDALIKAGHYKTSSELFKEALRSLLEIKPPLKLDVAVQLYEEGKVSIEKASEISGLCMEEFKEILARRGITRMVGYESREKLNKKVEELKTFRGK